jgi:hypothetical protein
MEMLSSSQIRVNDEATVEAIVRLRPYEPNRGSLCAQAPF